MNALRPSLAVLAVLAVFAVFTLPPVNEQFCDSALSAADPRDLAVTAVRDRPQFLVRVNVDRPSRIYHDGESMRVAVRSERDGFLYLFYCDASRNVTCLFPNKEQPDNRIKGGETTLVPSGDASFRLKVGPPFGREVLKAIVTTHPLQAGLGPTGETSFVAIGEDALKAVFVEAADGSSPVGQQWAEHHIQTTTKPRSSATTDETSASRRPRRIGVFVGVSRYADDRIRPLRTAHQDAQAMARVMRTIGRLDKTALLVDEQATLKNIRHVVQEQLPQMTRPGDEVFLYWSGHGGRISSQDDAEPDGYDEYLVPHDGRLAPASAVRETMLLDKTFGRWVQHLDGRRVVVILDACHSGGHAEGAVKALAPRNLPFEHFLFAEALERVKNIGQRDTALLASSRESQISLEKRDGKTSVMTGFLIEQIEHSPDGLTLPNAARHLKKVVPEFVEKHFPGTTQSPVFVDRTRAAVWLRPSLRAKP